MPPPPSARIVFLFVFVFTRQVDGESNEVCDSRLFLLDLSDQEGAWVAGVPLPGDCGVGQTMDTVRLVKGDDAQVLWASLCCFSLFLLCVVYLCVCVCVCVCVFLLDCL